MIKRMRPHDANMDLTVRSIGEDLWLWRHRMPSDMGHTRGRRAGGMSQEEFGIALGMTPNHYTKLENDEKIQVSAPEIIDICKWIPEFVTMETPSLAELCYLARRRSGKQLTEIAPAMNLSHDSYLGAEAIGREDVVLYWRRQGYGFPGLPAIKPERVTRPTRQAARLARPAA